MRKFKEEDVGARLWPASTTLGSKILIVECRRSIDVDLQLTPITEIFCLLAYRNILLSSEDSPDTLNTNNTS